MTTTMTTSHASVTGRLRRRVAQITPGQAGAGAYVVVALVAQAWAGLAIVGVVWAGLALRRRHAKSHPSSERLIPSRGLVALVLAAAAVAHSGLGRSILRTFVALLLGSALALAAVGEVLIAARFAAVVAAIAVALIVATWHQVGRHRGHGTYRAGALPDDGDGGTPWREVVAEGHTDPYEGPTEHYRRQIRRANRLREEEAAIVYAHGRADMAAGRSRPWQARRELSYGTGWAEGYEAGAEAMRAVVWSAEQ
jgi:hypothetical protein